MADKQVEGFKWTLASPVDVTAETGNNSEAATGCFRVVTMCLLCCYHVLEFCDQCGWLVSLVWSKAGWATTCIYRLSIYSGVHCIQQARVICYSKILIQAVTEKYYAMLLMLLIPKLSVNSFFQECIHPSRVPPVHQRKISHVEKMFAQNAQITYLDQEKVDGIE